ncbi:MAG TPA: hypothetical protein VG935_02235 [Patescibacteria group bacterium]|nr:hypothetical protein [Patescibacteria group bacterium]
MKFIHKLALSLAAFLALSAFAIPAFADAGDTTIWNLVGTYTVNFHCDTVCSGDYPHTMTVSTENFDTGAFSGNGNYIPDASYSWDMTGTVNANTVSFQLVYNNNLNGYTVTTNTGTIANDGTMSGTATASDGSTFTWSTTDGHAKSKKIKPHQEVNKKACEAKGAPMIDVVEHIKNDSDSGQAGNYWAFDNFTREIKVWNLGGSNYCANVIDNGTSTTVQNQTGPGGAGTISGNFKADMSGGYRTTQFSATYSPTWKTHGNVGVVDYQCTISGYCPRRVDWQNQYFTNLSGFDYAWWGWTYKAGKHGTWTNSITGNSGNIL